MRAYKLALLFMASYSLSGCFGAGTVTEKTLGWYDNDAGNMALCPTSYEKMIIACENKSLPNQTGAKNIKPDTLIRMWGAPNSENVINGVRTLTYRHGLAWRGLTVFVILPIPLLLPMGYNSAKFSFNNENLVHVEYTYNELDATVCGLHSEGPDGVGCVTHWH
ncbi:hypothetical protein [Duganella sp. S19_KUP01_CR8]|uniref:hypothetical protein n=1 Tax=Duganella sp. S19_KUP01_CR8 TaxID=3025502 RepID=UPI002FCDDD64